MFSAWTVTVNIVLDDCGEDKGKGGDGKARRNAVKRGDGDVKASTEEGKDEVFKEWDKDDERDWVNVGDEVVGDAVRVHGRRLGDEVVVHLVITEPWRICELSCPSYRIYWKERTVYRKPEKDLAGTQPAC